MFWVHNTNIHSPISTKVKLLCIFKKAPFMTHLETTKNDNNTAIKHLNIKYFFLCYKYVSNCANSIWNAD